MTDAATTLIRLELLKKARDTGVLSIRHGDTTTEFRSLDEIEKIIAVLEGNLGITSTRRRRLKYAYQSDKGY